MAVSLPLSERLDALRRDLSRLQGPGTAAQSRAAGLPAGRAALHPLFAAGQAFGGLHEIVASGPEDLFTAAGFGLDFIAACAKLRPRAGCVLVLEDMVAWETGLPYGPGLAAAGLDPARLILIRTSTPKETLLAMETALRSTAVAAVLAESAIAPRLYDLATSRRLLTAARTGGGAALLVPTALAGKAARLSSAATARFEIARARSRAVPFGSARVPIPGRPAFVFRLLKAPGGLTDAAARNREQWQPGVFGVPLPEAAFHAFSFNSPALPVDRSDPSPRETDGLRRIA